MKKGAYFLTISVVASVIFLAGNAKNVAAQKVCSTSSGAIGDPCMGDNGNITTFGEYRTAQIGGIPASGSTQSDSGIPGNGATQNGVGIPANGNTQSSLDGNGIYVPENTGLAGGSVKAILENLLRWLLGIVGVIALIGFVISGIQYVISTGQEDMMETAKRNMMYSIMGVVVALAGFVIIQAIDFALRAQSF